MIETVKNMYPYAEIESEQYTHTERKRQREMEKQRQINSVRNKERESVRGIE